MNASLTSSWKFLIGVGLLVLNTSLSAATLTPQTLPETISAAIQTNYAFGRMTADYGGVEALHAFAVQSDDSDTPAKIVSLATAWLASNMADFPWPCRDTSSTASTCGPWLSSAAAPTHILEFIDDLRADFEGAPGADKFRQDLLNIQRHIAAEVGPRYHEWFLKISRLEMISIVASEDLTTLLIVRYDLGA